MTDKLITDLQELTEVTEATYVPVRNATAGTRKYNLKSLNDTVSSAAAQATSAASQAIDAKNQAAAATQTANQAADTATDASERAEAAIEAIGDISELAVPLMSADTRGGAKLGSGLKLDSDALSLGDVVTDSCDGPIYSVDAQGWAEQQSTVGKNLLDAANATFLSNATCTFANDALIVTATTSNTWSNAAFDHVCSEGQQFVLSFEETGLLFSITFLDSQDAAIGDVIYTNNATAPAGSSKIRIRFYARATSSGSVGDSATFTHPQLEAGSTATSYEPYSGGVPGPNPDHPFPIEVCRGRNLLNLLDTASYIASDGTVVTSYANWRASDYIDVSGIATVVASGFTNTTAGSDGVAWYAADKSFISKMGVNAFKASAQSVPANAHYLRVSVMVSDIGTAQLELGSTPSPYVPYGHVGLDIYDANDAHVSTVPIPLPSKGWAGGLPDGTADALTVDSAGRWEWESVSDEVVFDGSSDESWYDYTSTGYEGFFVSDVLDAIQTRSSGYCSALPVYRTQGATGVAQCWLGVANNRIYFAAIKSLISISTVSDFKTWLSTHNVTVLYPLATPTTEHGYIADWPVEVPEGATITIRELSDVNVKCFLPSVKELAAHVVNWNKRTKYEDEQIEDAIADLASRVAALE